jgi:hypothetical protein
MTPSALACTPSSATSRSAQPHRQRIVDQEAQVTNPFRVRRTRGLGWRSLCGSPGIARSGRMPSQVRARWSTICSVFTVIARLPSSPARRVCTSRRHASLVGAMACDHTVDPTVSWCAPSSPVPVETKSEQRVLTGADCPTAMFVSSDLQAFGVLRANRERALDVPVISLS